MTLSDAKFLRSAQVPLADEPRPDFKRALKGIGDKLTRETSDFWGGFAGTATPEPGRSFSSGDTVEYVTPDGVRRVGTLCRATGDAEWLVQLDEHEYHYVPQGELRLSDATPRVAARKQARAALQRTSSWRLRRHPEQQSDGATLLTIDAGHGKVSDDQVMAYAASLGYEALEASREGNLIRIVAQELPTPSPSEPTGGEEPGLETETIEGTGLPHGKAGALKKAGYKLGSEIEDPGMVTVPFTVPRMYLTPEGRVTATLRPDAMPLSGYFEYDANADTLRRFVYTAEGTVEAPYSSGTGPESIRENEPGGFEDGDYVVKADAVEAGTDKKTKDYYKNYYGPYGEKLTRKVPRKKHKASADDLIVEAFIRRANRKPTDEEAVACHKVLATFGASRMPRVAGANKHVRMGQMVPAKDIVNKLMAAAAQDESLKKQLHRVVLNEISSDPASILNRIDQTIYPRLLFVALQGNQGRKLLRMYRQSVPDEDKVQPDLGSPEMFQEPGAPSEEAARKYLEGNSPEFSSLPPPAQAEMVKQLLQDPPDELKQQQAPQSPQVMLPQQRKKPTLKERAKEFGKGLKDRMPGGQRDIDKMVQDVEDDEYEEEKAREQLRQGARTPAGMHNRQRPLGHQVRPQIDRITSKGGYLCIRMVWDPECCAGMSDSNIKHNIETWLKGMTTLKEEYPDLGFIGKPKFKSFDPDAGIAELLVASSRSRDYSQEVVTVDGEGFRVDPA